MSCMSDKRPKSSASKEEILYRFVGDITPPECVISSSVAMTIPYVPFWCSNDPSEAEMIFFWVIICGCDLFGIVWIFSVIMS